MNRIELLNQLLEYTIWMPIKGYENYEISICGSVRNIKTKKFTFKGRESDKTPSFKSTS